MSQNNNYFLKSVLLASSLMCTPMVAQSSVLMKPTPSQELTYQKSLLPSQVDESITKPEAILGFPVGQRTATPEQIETLVKTWAKESDKITYSQYATSYEGRPLHLLTISSPNNLKNLSKIKQDIDSLANDSSLSKSATNKIIDRLPATAWMAYSIHGNESSGADSALALIYYLIASKDEKISSLLDNMVILVDPVMNPDGRARFTKMLEQHRGTAANIDPQSLLHAGVWPYGRTNHYYYDLNRDFYFLQAPETRGRVSLINEWYPQLMIDGHEMGSQDTYLFGPAREPINKNLPESKMKWGNVFAKDQGNAFDDEGWTYYTGEWFENLYPGYSNYAEYRGSVHILYEQARTAEDGVRLRNDQVRTYQQSVHQQLVSSLANLDTLAKNTKAMYKDFAADRKLVSSKKSPYANKSYVILPSKNLTRKSKFVELLQAQNITVNELTKPVNVKSVKDQHGNTFETKTLPAGALVINARQPEARLLNAILEFDATITDAVLLEEWQRTMRDGSSLMYDNTAWNLTMLYGLPALEVGQEVTRNLKPYKDKVTDNTLANSNIAWFAAGSDDASVSLAAQLMEQGIYVRVVDKAGELGSLTFERGSIAVLKSDNPRIDNLQTIVQNTAKNVGVALSGADLGLGDGDLPDIGGSHFKLLERPQVAILSRGAINTYDFGAIWHMMDTNLGIRHSHVDIDRLSRADLRQYNVIVLPELYGSLSKGQSAALDNWIKQGGTLITSGGATRQVLNSKLSNVVPFDKALEKAKSFDLSLQREWLAQQNAIPNKALVSSHKMPEDISSPWKTANDLKGMSKDKLKVWNEWSKKFMPSGAIVGGRTDQKHWLTFGVDKSVPLLVSNPPLLMSDDKTRAVIRVGTLQKNGEAKARMVGWSTIPEGYDLNVRMSGLLWPEAAQRIANSAYLTRERKGRGQIILFADKPIVRGATKGTERLLLNAVVYGPGLGARQVTEL